MIQQQLKARWDDDYAEDWVTRVLPQMVYLPALIQPELTRLLGEVGGKAILDAGCGEGIYSRYLKTAGAEVVGIDSSAKMIAFARERDPDIEFRLADLLGLLEFPDERFDAVVSLGVLMSLPRLDTFLAESMRILKHRGSLVIGVHHPAFSNPTMRLHQPFWAKLRGQPVTGLTFSYFDKDSRDGAGRRWPFHHRTIEEYVDAFRAYDFQLDRITEPHSLPQELLEDGALEYVTRLPRFIFFKLVKP